MDDSSTILLGVSALHGCSSPMATVVSYPAVGTGNGIKKAVSPGKGSEDGHGSIASPRMKVTFLAPQLSEPTIIASCKVSMAVICITKSRTGNYDFRACARARGFPGSTVFGRTHTLRRVCRAITR